MTDPVFGSHTQSDPSSEMVTTSLPSGVNAPASTGPVWPENTCMTRPADIHIHTVPSELPARMMLPRG